MVETDPEEGGNTENAQDKLSKEQKLEVEKNTLEEAIRSNSLNSIRERVAYILNNYPEARNSDKILALIYWKVFQKESFDPSLSERLFRLEHVPTLSRERAKIQNSFNLFQSEDKVRKRRKQLKVEKQENYAAIDKIEPKIVVYADETGKASPILSVGGVWFLDPTRYFDAWTSLNEWKRLNNIKSEFKFSGLSKNECPIALAYIKEFLKFQSFTSFKIVWLSACDLRRPKEQAVYDLYRYFIIEGVKFEVAQKRIVLPLKIELVKDKDEGSDIINLKDMEIALGSNLETVFKGEMSLRNVSATDSKHNPVLQGVDLIIGSFGRVLNQDGIGQNHKDVFAIQILDILGIDRKTFTVVGNNDWLQIAKIDADPDN